MALFLASGVLFLRKYFFLLSRKVGAAIRPKKLTSISSCYPTLSSLSIFFLSEVLMITQQQMLSTCDIFSVWVLILIDFVRGFEEDG